MAREPSIPHKAIVDFILAGYSTRDAKEHFRFKTDNISNLRVNAAFKSVGVPRPRYAENRVCEFCGVDFVARDFKQRTCGAQACQTALIGDWHKNNPDTTRLALKRYRGTEKGRQNNLRMHRIRRERGRSGSLQDRWNFATSEIKKSLRKLSYLASRNHWEYRLQHIQKVAQFNRRFTPRNVRGIAAVTAPGMWQEALRAVQTTLLQYRSSVAASQWECTVNRISQAIRTGHKVKEWKAIQPLRQSHLTS